jgi:hypothetical protein
MAAKQKNQPLFFPFLFASFGEQVVEHLAEDESCKNAFTSAIAGKIRKRKEDFATQAEFMAKVVTPVMEAFLDKACPSVKNRKPIVQWVLGQYLEHRHNDKPILAEDLYKIDDYLKFFEGLRNAGALKKSGDNPDLLQYKTYAAFEKMLEPHLRRKAQKEMLADMFNMTPAQKAQIMAETTILYDGDEGRVIVPHTAEASKYWGSNTKWCIAAREQAENYFPQYNAKSPVIMILPKGQSNNKIALVDKTLWDSADNKIPALPEPHSGLMKQCLNGLSDGVRNHLAAWMPEEVFSTPAFVYVEPDTATWMAIYNEVEAVSDSKKSPDKALWKNPNSVLAAIRMDPRAVKYAAPVLAKNPQFWQAAVRQNVRVLLNAPLAIQRNQDVMLTAVEHGVYIFNDTDRKLCSNREFMLAAVRKNGNMLYHATWRLCEDREIVEAAVNQNGDALEHAADKFQNDRALLLMSTNSYLQWHNHREWGFDRAFILEAVKKNGIVLQHAFEDPAMKKDPEIVVAAVQQNALALSYADVLLKSNRDFVYPLLEKIEDLPFHIRRLAKEKVWQPDDNTLAHFQLQSLEKMVARGDMEKFIKYARPFKSTWGDPDALFAADPAATLEKIKAEIAPAASAAPRRVSGLRQ